MNGQRSLKKCISSAEGYLLVPATDHATHRQAHASITKHHIGQQLGSCRHWDPLLVTELVKPEDRHKTHVYRLVMCYHGCTLQQWKVYKTCQLCLGMFNALHVHRMVTLSCWRFTPPLQILLRQTCTPSPEVSPSTDSLLHNQTWCPAGKGWSRSPYSPPLKLTHTHTKH